MQQNQLKFHPPRRRKREEKEKKKREREKNGLSCNLFFGFFLMQRYLLFLLNCFRVVCLRFFFPVFVSVGFKLIQPTEGRGAFGGRQKIHGLMEFLVRLLLFLVLFLPFFALLLCFYLFLWLLFCSRRASWEDLGDARDPAATMMAVSH